MHIIMPCRLRGGNSVHAGVEMRGTTVRGFNFRRGVVEAFALLGCYATLVGSWLPTFRNNILAPYDP